MVDRAPSGPRCAWQSSVEAAHLVGPGLALAIGCAYVESTQTGHTTSPELAEQYAAVDAAVLKPLRAALGLDRAEWCASAAAPMPVEVATFFAGLGLSIYDVYGMTQTTGSATANGPDAFRLGTVGRP